ncbi:MAG: tRNA (N6-isopentenyl adenosine(37)-C2)-methylthiotransferase MiaB, partial [Aurantimicrobium sp.]
MTSPSEAPTLIPASSAAVDETGRQRTYEVRTFGCQMNVHDSERLAGAMEAAGYVKFEFATEAELDP